MSNDWNSDWNDDDDDWPDDYEDDDAMFDVGNCPECQAELHVDAESCPSCGHWLSTAERHKLWDGGSKSKAAMSTGKLLLVLLLVVLFLGSLFGVM